jgi:signal transduction histidine kinase
VLLHLDTLGGRAAEARIERHGGRIDVASAPGRGSTFRVVLPLARREAPSPAVRA